MSITDLWNFLLVYPLLSLLVGAYNVIADFGFAVVIVTLAIRLLLYPLYVNQIRSQRAMQEVAPALKEIQTKYKGDRQRLAAEQMKLYKERGVSPLGGCLPLLLQMPILFAMYAAFVQAPQLDGEQIRQAVWPFLPLPGGLGPSDHLDMTAHWLPWIQSCDQSGSTGLFGGTTLSGIGLHGLACKDPWFVLPVVAGLLQLIASIQAMPADQPKSDDPQVAMTRSMSYYFPLITVYFASQFPSGLAVYWVTTTVFQIVQQYFVSGWGGLPGLRVPGLGLRPFAFLRNIATPADRLMAQRSRAAIAEVEADMRTVPARAEDDDPRRRRRRRRGR